MKKYKNTSPEELTEIIYDRMTELVNLIWAMFFTATSYDEDEEYEQENFCACENDKKWETTGEFGELDDALPF